MRIRGPGALLFLVALACAACQGFAGTAAPSPSPSGATSYLEFRAGFCSAWEDLFRGIGNPDAGSDSELSAAMDQAITDGDLASVDRLAADITAALESGRAHARFAGGWVTGAPVTEALDGVFVAFEVMIEAKRMAAAQGPDEAPRIAQAAFEKAGGADAWVKALSAMQVEETMRAVASARPSGMDTRCANVPIGI